MIITTCGYSILLNKFSFTNKSFTYSISEKSITFNNSFVVVIVLVILNYHNYSIIYIQEEIIDMDIT
jgi:hypothetical protein